MFPIDLETKRQKEVYFAAECHMQMNVSSIKLNQDLKTISSLRKNAQNHDVTVVTTRSFNILEIDLV